AAQTTPSAKRRSGDRRRATRKPWRKSPRPASGTLRERVPGPRLVLAFGCAAGHRRKWGLRSMIRRRDVLSLLAGAALPWARPTVASETILDEYVAFAGQVLFLTVKKPALVLGVVRDGQTSIQGFGRRADNASEAPGADTPFRIGSLTKSFT